MFKHLPNILTILRMLLVPVFPLVFFSGHPLAHRYALAVYVAASFTDLLDGYLARRYDLITKVGVVLDPLADKLMLMAALVCLYIDQTLPLWVLAVIVVHEVFLISAGVYLYFRKRQFVIPSNKFGKSATVLFFIGVSLNLLLPDSLVSQFVIGAAIAVKLAALISYGRIYYAQHSQDERSTKV